MPLSALIGTIFSPFYLSKRTDKRDNLLWMFNLQSITCKHYGLILYNWIEKYKMVNSIMFDLPSLIGVCESEIISKGMQL